MNSSQSDPSVSGTIALITFISTIPPNVDPFMATSQWLTETQSVAASIWPYMIALEFGTRVLIYLRVSNGRFSIGSVTRLTIACMTLQLTVQDGHDTYAQILALYGSKFITLYLSAWVFCWACACQCALASLERPWYESLHKATSSSRSPKRQDIIRWVINVLVPGVAVSSTAVIIWSFVMSQLTYQRLQKTLRAVHASLDAASEKFDPKTYKISDLIEALTPGQKITTILIYTPLLLATPRAMRQQAAANFKPNMNNTTSIIEGREKRRPFSWRRPMGNTNIEYAILLAMGWFVELAALSYLPMIIWQSWSQPRMPTVPVESPRRLGGPHGHCSLERLAERNLTDSVMIMAITQTRRLLTRSKGGSSSELSSGLRSLTYSAKTLQKQSIATSGSPEPKQEFDKSVQITIPEAAVHPPDSPVSPFDFGHTPAVAPLE
ncbi:uncharacterized protein MELLADRAFT_101013 [Melampsora larici-populina 98AG31]|uniref:Uncharacterized protein n=1 Tax=Melampsora larici-populina (strain 98AG31 / pathotype 3-4-7) TaxID=747676 RepID=F4R3B9_MELLP|nr:uncharacterized protein MELLADRAFT_101013 [Melampsora larici-populina 98AG31]EGG12601.1 hypothetical protein MELLADRAFT_101013 [Melampsora larici-populina 98AG31]